MTGTCPGEGGDGAQGQGSAQAPGQRGGGRLTLPGTLVVIDELGQVGRRGGDEGVHQVRWQGEGLAAEGGHHGVTCKESATQQTPTWTRDQNQHLLNTLNVTAGHFSEGPRLQLSSDLGWTRVK